MRHLPGARHAPVVCAWVQSNKSIISCEGKGVLQVSGRCLQHHQEHACVAVTDAALACSAATQSVWRLHKCLVLMCRPRAGALVQVSEENAPHLLCEVAAI